MILGGVAAKGAHTEHKGCRRNSKLFEKAGKLCLCGLQGINGLEGAWRLLVDVFAAWLCVSWRNAGADAEDAEVTQKAQKEIPNLFGKG